MCIRDSLRGWWRRAAPGARLPGRRRVLERADLLGGRLDLCLLYTSDAADERSSVDLGGRRIIKKKKDAHPPRR